MRLEWKEIDDHGMFVRQDDNRLFLLDLPDGGLLADGSSSGLARACSGRQC